MAAFPRRLLAGVAMIALFTALPCRPASAELDFNLQTITTRIAFSDNGELESDNREPTLTLRTGAGVSATYRATRLNAALSANVPLDFRVLGDLENSDDVELGQNVAFGGAVIPWPERFTIGFDVTSRRELPDDEDRISFDPISDNRNRSTVTNLSVDPGLTLPIGRYAFLTAATGFRVSLTGRDNSNDTDNQTYLARLSSGLGFSRLNWSLSYNLSQSSGGEGGDTDSENYTFNTGYRINEHFRVNGSVGFRKLTGRSPFSNDQDDGLTWNIGVNYTLSDRVSFNVSYGDQFGTRTVNGSVQARVAENWFVTASASERLDLLERFVAFDRIFFDPQTETFFDGLTGLDVELSDFGFGIAEEVSVLRNYQLSLGGTYDRLGISVGFSAQRRQFEARDNELQANVNLDVSYELGTKWRVSTRLDYRFESGDTGAEESERTVGSSLRLSRELGANGRNLVFAYTRTQRRQDDSPLGIEGREYTENSASVALTFSL